MVNFKIVNEVNDYMIRLGSVNLRNNLDGKVKTLGIGVNVEFPDIIKGDMEFIVPININIVIANSETMKDDNFESIEDEDILVKINFIYTVHMKVNTMDIIINKEEIQDYAYFLAEPKIKQEVLSMGNSIGIPNLIIPTKRYLNDKKQK